MDYCDILGDPLKYYFKQKIGSIYVNREVVDMLWRKAEKEDTVPFETFGKREHKELNVGFVGKRRSDNVLKKYTKKLQFWKKMKEKQKEDEKMESRSVCKIRQSMINAKAKVIQFNENDRLHSINIKNQSSYINRRLYNRKIKAFHRDITRIHTSPLRATPRKQSTFNLHKVNIFHRKKVDHIIKKSNSPITSKLSSSSSPTKNKSKFGSYRSFPTLDLKELFSHDYSKQKDSGQTENQIDEVEDSDQQIESVEENTPQTHVDTPKNDSIEGTSRRQFFSNENAIDQDKMTSFYDQIKKSEFNSKDIEQLSDDEPKDDNLDNYFDEINRYSQSVISLRMDNKLGDSQVSYGLGSSMRKPVTKSDKRDQRSLTDPNKDLRDAIEFETGKIENSFKVKLLEDDYEEFSPDSFKLLETDDKFSKKASTTKETVKNKLNRIKKDVNEFEFAIELSDASDLDY